MTDDNVDSGPPPCSELCIAEHDICLTRSPPEQGGAVIASVACPFAGGAVTIEHCVKCPRFARIEVHEAGYTLLCRSRPKPVRDESLPEDP